jgi:hypothetical protein
VVDLLLRGVACPGANCALRLSCYSRHARVSIRQHTSAYVSMRAACGLPVVLAMFVCCKFTTNLEPNLLLLYLSSKLVLSCYARYAGYVREVQVQEAFDALKREGVHTHQ